MKLKRCKKLMMLLATAMIAAMLAPSVAYATDLTASNFDAKRYADTYADLKAAFGYDEAKLWVHYQNFGAKEGRQAFAKGGSSAVTSTPVATGVTQANFDAKRYADTYADLKAAFGYDEAKLWAHYQNFGAKEGRQAFAKGAPVAATPATQQQPVPQQATPAPAGNFLSASACDRVAAYADSLGIVHDYPSPDPLGNISFSALPRGGSVRLVNFTLPAGGNHWICRAWSWSQVPPIAEANAYSTDEMIAFLQRYR